MLTGRVKLGVEQRRRAVAAPEEVRGQAAQAHGQGSSDGDLSPPAGGQAGAWQVSRQAGPWIWGAGAQDLWLNK